MIGCADESEPFWCGHGVSSATSTARSGLGCLISRLGRPQRGQPVVGAGPCLWLPAPSLRQSPASPRPQSPSAHGIQVRQTPRSPAHQSRSPLQHQPLPRPRLCRPQRPTVKHAKTGGFRQAIHQVCARRPSVLPPDVKVGDPAATSNPQWASSIRRAADLYTQASAALDGSIAPGATSVLSEAARTSVCTLRVLGEAIRTSDPITGNAVTMANESTQLTGALCVRLAQPKGFSALAFGEVMMPMTEHSAEILAGSWPASRSCLGRLRHGVLAGRKHAIQEPMSRWTSSRF